MKNILLCLALLLPCLARAEGVFSGLWITPQEPGWGLSIHHDKDIMFVTLLVYNEQGLAQWYVAPNVRRFWSIADEDVGFAGDLYVTTGPLLSNERFDPSRVAMRRVGEIDVSVMYGVDGGVHYTIDGKDVWRPIQPLRW
jgi:hypothetical protein